MNLLELIADVLRHPDHAVDRMEMMGVSHDIIEHIVHLVQLESDIKVESDNGRTTISFGHEL